MSDDRRLIVALVLSVAVIFVYFRAMDRFFPSKRAGTPAQEAAPAAPTARVRGKTAVSPTSPARSSTARALTAGALTARALAADEGLSGGSREAAPGSPVLKGAEVTVENGSFAARFSTAGGRLVSWQLKAYRATGTTQFEDLVPLRAALFADAPLSVRLSDDPSSAWRPAKPSLALLSVRPGELVQRVPGRRGETVVVSTSRGEVLFTQALSGRRTLVRRLSVPAQGCAVDMEIELTGPAPASLEVIWAPGTGYSKDEELSVGRPETYQNVSNAVVATRTGMIKQGEDKKPVTKEEDFPFWAAVRNKYFVAALVPPDPKDCEGVTGVTGIASTDGTRNNLCATLRFALAPGARRVRIPLRVYAGPQVYEEMKAAGPRLEKALDLGFFGVIAFPILQALKFLAAYVHNYGVAIIILTIIIKALLWLPSQWGLNQMQRMKDVQPQINFINETYKDDPRRKQEEIMRIYREKKVNPVGGCLPMLIQIPIFFALFSALGNAIELKGAPFALWIRDLSAMDPIYVMPILVGVTMFVQQAMTPVVGDPKQAKMMRWMSLAFVVMFIKMPSGLMVYWLAQNLMQIGQQWWTNRQAATAPSTGRN